MIRFLRPAAVVPLVLASLAAATGSRSPAAAGQEPGPLAQTLLECVDRVRRHYTSSRVAGAQLELSGTLDQLRAMLSTMAEEPRRAAGGLLPKAGRDVPMPAFVERVEPAYPIAAAKKGVTGIVVVDAVIDKAGKVRDARVARSVPELDGAALTAVRKWRFARPTVGGAAAEVAASLAVAFTPRRDSPPTDELDLATFYLERAEYAAAEEPLARALDTIGTEAGCIAAVSSVAGEQRKAGAGEVEPARKVRDVRPTYPALARKAKVTGTVALEAIIGPDGRPACLRVLRSVPLLDQAALDAVSRWQFTPMLRGGAPVPSRISVELDFDLR